MRCATDDGECVSGRLRRGMCEKHYRRWKATGTTDLAAKPPLLNYAIDINGCWLWEGAMYTNGYGRLRESLHGTPIAHRAVYVEHRGAIPKGLDLDHLCRVRRCVNPQHLEPVSRSENLVRGHQARTLCRAGLHDVTKPDAVRPGTMQCLECWRIRYRAGGAKYRAKRRDASHSAP